MGDIPDLYDVKLNGLGYLLHTAQFSTGTGQAQDPFTKRHRDLLVEQQDFGNDIAENKMEGLFWSSQRSWYAGGGQRRLDNPQTSHPERWLRAKNVDTFNERGVLTLAHMFDQLVDGETGNNQTEGFCTSSDGHLYWVTPDPANADEVLLRSITTWGGSVSERGFDANWSSGSVVQGLTNDGEFVYASNSVTGIWRGQLDQQTTALDRWTTQGARDIAHIKERLMGHTTSSDKVQIWEFAEGVSPNLVKEYPLGWKIRTATGAQSVFAAIGGFIAWVISNGRDGTLWLWDGEEDPFQAAVFPGFQSWGLVSYAESQLYVIGRDPAGAPFLDSWVIIRCEVGAGGTVEWGRLHEIDGLVRPVGAVQRDEILIPARLESDDISGLTSDSGVVGGRAATVASFSVASDGLNLARHWGRGSTSVTDPLWNDSGFTEPDLCMFRAAAVMTGEDGSLRAETTQHADLGELISSRIDYNIDVDKVFLIAEAGFEPLKTVTSVTLQITTDDPDQSPTWTTVGLADVNGDTLVRGRTGEEGTRSKFLYYRLQLFGRDNSPEVKKAGCGAVYARKPRPSHVLIIKAFPPAEMELRNGQRWPGDRTPTVIQSELEALWENQTVVDFEEPTYGTEARSAVKVQLREMQVTKQHIPGEGWAMYVIVQLTETPEE